MYGTLFMMGGAYTLSRGGHVRGDFLYRLWQPRTQARVDLVLYVFFFFPGVTALIFSGWKYASRSWGYQEVSVNSPAGIPIFQFKMIIVAAGILLVHPGHRRDLPLHPLHPRPAPGRGRRRTFRRPRRSPDARSERNGPRAGGAPMTDPQVALLMLGLFIFLVFLGFPIAFTLMAMGIGFGYYAYFDADRMWRALNRLDETASALGQMRSRSRASSTTASSTSSSTRPSR